MRKSENNQKIFGSKAPEKETREKGADFLEEISGIFAFALYDETDGSYLIARDPIGVIPLHIGYDEDGTVYVASELKALGVLAIVAWAFCLGWITMKVLDKTMGIRVDPRIEEEGLDIYEHGETAYNS